MPTPLLVDILPPNFRDGSSTSSVCLFGWGSEICPRQLLSQLDGVPQRQSHCRSSIDNSHQHSESCSNGPTVAFLITAASKARIGPDTIFIACTVAPAGVLEICWRRPTGRNARSMQCPPFLIPRLHHLIQPQHSLASSVPRLTGLCLVKITSRETALFLYIPTTVHPKVLRSFLCAHWVVGPTSGRSLILWTTEISSPIRPHSRLDTHPPAVRTLCWRHSRTRSRPTFLPAHAATDPRVTAGIEVRARRCTSLGHP